MVECIKEIWVGMEGFEGLLQTRYLLTEEDRVWDGVEGRGEGGEERKCKVLHMIVMSVVIYVFCLQAVMSYSFMYE